MNPRAAANAARACAARMGATDVLTQIKIIEAGRALADGRPVAPRFADVARAFCIGAGISIARKREARADVSQASQAVRAHRVGAALRAGWTPAEIVSTYPDVTTADLAAADPRDVSAGEAHRAPRDPGEDSARAYAAARGYGAEKTARFIATYHTMSRGRS